MNNYADDDTLLSRKETAKILHISVPTLLQYQKEQRIPYCRIEGRVLFKKAEVLESIELPFKYQRKY
jgi:predicted site-specific integrase-resolvase